MRLPIPSEWIHFNNEELRLNSDASNMESRYIIFICITNRKCNRSATKTPSHKEKILISKHRIKGENSFLKKSDDDFPFCK